VQLRAHGEVHRATAGLAGDVLRITLDQPAQGVAKGQAAVLYDGDNRAGQRHHQRYPDPDACPGGIRSLTLRTRADLGEPAGPGGKRTPHQRNHESR